MSGTVLGVLGSAAVTAVIVTAVTWLAWRWEEKQINRAFRELSQLS